MQPQRGPARSRAVLPDFTVDIASKYIYRGYTKLCRHFPTLALLTVAASLGLELANMLRVGQLSALWQVAQETNLTFNLVTAVACCSMLVAAALSSWLLQTRPVFLVDFAVHRPPDSWKMDKVSHMRNTGACGKFTPRNVDFQAKILARSGLGDETYLPPGLQEVPPAISMSDARWEFEQVCFSSIKEVLAKAGVAPRQVGVVVVNCSLFNPTPSLSAMVMNHFKMGSNTINYNLGGMGCSAGVVAVDLARQMLQLYPDTYALVVSTENITQNWYFGNDRSMLIPNCLFRVGGAAMLLSNKRKDGWRAKYELQHVVRTNLAANDAAFNCVYEGEDEDGTRGVRLSKELMAIAGNALKTNITTLGPLVLPVSEQLLFGAVLLARKLLGKKRVSPYVPDFKLAFEHVCIHTGGRGVIDEIEKQLALSPAMIEPSRAVLYRYGNISSSSIWYVLSFVESTGGVRKGDRIWQLGFGSGFKCNSAVWRANRRVREAHYAWEGFDIEKMRAELHEIADLH
ncbi:MAG: FAE1/Type III polyketide synthase-like protein-domain-containing protein [Monoraphidium minutum]|nr:MAG: FAE1/Type III polyketide synthase-like protein-domain-containing protein [Monoraphidium minutum]